MADTATPLVGAGSGASASAASGPAETAGPSGLTTRIRLLAGLLAFSLALTLALLFWSAKSQDEIAVEGSRHLANTALRVQLGYLQKTLTDYTFWDDAYENMAEAFDPEWFDEEFGAGAYLHDTFGITVSFVVGPDNRVLRLMVDSEIAEDARARGFGPRVEGGFAKLLQEARTMRDGEFEAVGGLIRMDGQLYFAVVRAIHPHTEEKLADTTITPADAYLAGFMRPLDDELLASLAVDFGLKDLRYVSDTDLPEDLTRPLHAPDGRKFGTLTWRIDLPSRHALLVVLPALLAVIACLGLLSWYVLNSLRRSQTELWLMMQRARSADRTKTEFLANMSHELRTPLNAIIGFAEMMRNGVFGPLGDERYVDYSANIHDCGQHLLNIITDVLEISKVEIGSFDLRETEIDVQDLMSSACGMIALRAVEKEITFDVEVAPNPPNLYADEGALKQILVHLLTNAVKFTPNGGRVVLEVTHDAAGALRLSVSDTGVGIPKDQIPIVMEPFRHVTGPLTASGGGVGLGLPLTASLVALHGGAIRIESEAGKGTAVIVEFPAGRTVLAKAA